MSFTERANKRKLCALLARFLAYADHMMINLLHQILSESFRNFSNVFRGYDSTQSSEKTPFMSVELLLKPATIAVDPSREVAASFMEQICTMVVESTRRIVRFQSDAYFNIFTEYVLKVIKFYGVVITVSFSLQQTNDHGPARRPSVWKPSKL